MKKANRAILIAGFFLGVIVVFQNCSPVAFQNQEVASLGENPAPDIVPPISPDAPRCTFDGQHYAEGQTVTAYQSSTVPYGQTCRSEVRVCGNGTFTGSYPYSHCGEGAANSCLFNGQTIAHGESVTAYAASSATYGSTCTSQERVCNNGTLSGTYAFASCTVGTAKSCLFNGQTVAHGQSVVAYAQASVPYGQVCAAQNRACNNGVLSGTYTSSSCTVAAPLPPGPKCTVVANPSVLRPFVQSGNKCITSNYSFTFNCDKDIVKPYGFRAHIDATYKDGSKAYLGGSSYYHIEYESYMYPRANNSMALPASAFTMNGPRSLTISAEWLLRNYGRDVAYDPVYGCNRVQKYDVQVNFYVNEPTAISPFNPKEFINLGEMPTVTLPAN